MLQHVRLRRDIKTRWSVNSNGARTVMSASSPGWRSRNQRGTVRLACPGGWE